MHLRIHNSSFQALMPNRLEEVRILHDHPHHDNRHLNQSFLRHIPHIGRPCGNHPSSLNHYFHQHPFRTYLHHKNTRTPLKAAHNYNQYPKLLLMWYPKDRNRHLCHRSRRLKVWLNLFEMLYLPLCLRTVFRK